jgi:hypothetical protein
MTAERDQLRALIIGQPGDDHALCREAIGQAAAAAEAAGVERGRQLEAGERDRAWQAIARPIARGGPTQADLELRRWGEGGREHFADPRPGDFPGLGAQADPAVA